MALCCQVQPAHSQQALSGKQRLLSAALACRWSTTPHATFMRSLIRSNGLTVACHDANCDASSSLRLSSSSLNSVVRLEARLSALSLSYKGKSGLCKETQSFGLLGPDEDTQHQHGNQGFSLSMSKCHATCWAGPLL